MKFFRVGGVILRRFSVTSKVGILSNNVRNGDLRPRGVWAIGEYRCSCWRGLLLDPDASTNWHFQYATIASFITYENRNVSFYKSYSIQLGVATAL